MSRPSVFKLRHLFFTFVALGGACAQPIEMPQVVHYLSAADTALYRASTALANIETSVIPLADAGSLMDLGLGFGKDRFHAFKNGQAIPASDPESFVVLSENYAKDQDHVYYKNHIIVEADPSAFSYISVGADSWLGYEGYGMDAEHCFVQLLMTDCEALNSGHHNLGAYENHKEELLTQALNSLEFDNVVGRYESELSQSSLEDSVPDLARLKPGGMFFYFSSKNPLYAKETWVVVGEQDGQVLFNVYGEGKLGYKQVFLNRDATLPHTVVTSSFIELFLSFPCLDVVGDCNFEMLNEFELLDLDLKEEFEIQTVAVNNQVALGVWTSTRQYSDDMETSVVYARDRFGLPLFIQLKNEDNDIVYYRTQQNVQEYDLSEQEAVPVEENPISEPKSLPINPTAD